MKMIVQNMANKSILLILLFISHGVSVTSAENDQLSAISFETNYASNLNSSTYKENYISIKISTSEVQLKSISYCFRAKFYNIFSNTTSKRTTIIQQKEIKIFIPSCKSFFAFAEDGCKLFALTNRDGNAPSY